MFAQIGKYLRFVRGIGLTALVLCAGGAAAWMANQHPVSGSAPAVAAAPEAEKIQLLGTDRMVVPESIAKHLALKTALVQRSERSVPLPLFQGTLALDSNSLQRVHSRFPGEIIELGPARPGSSPRGKLWRYFARCPVPTLQFGDTVEAGQLLAVVWSKDLGEKKSELIDTLSKYKLDARVAERLRTLYAENGTAEKSVLDAERTVDQDLINIKRIEDTLTTFRLTKADIAKVRAEAASPDSPRSSAADWARVEIRAAQAGVILEKNVSVGDTVETGTDLYRIGNLKSLAVWAHVYEDDLPLVAELPKPLAWTVSLPSRPSVTYPGTLEQIGSVIDPNQHTALVCGRVENPDGELKIGQLVTVSLLRPARSGELTVPTDALVEDGVESIVLVQPDPAKNEFERRRVTVLRRTRDAIYLRDEPGLRRGERVVTTGSLLLYEAMKAIAPTPAPAP